MIYTGDAVYRDGQQRGADCSECTDIFQLIARNLCGDDINGVTGVEASFGDIVSAAAGYVGLMRRIRRCSTVEGDGRSYFVNFLRIHRGVGGVRRYRIGNGGPFAGVAVLFGDFGNHDARAVIHQLHVHQDAVGYELHHVLILGKDRGVSRVAGNCDGLAAQVVAAVAVGPVSEGPAVSRQHGKNELALYRGVGGDLHFRILQGDLGVRAGAFKIKGHIRNSGAIGLCLDGKGLEGVHCRVGHISGTHCGDGSVPCAVITILCRNAGVGGQVAFGHRLLTDGDAVGHKLHRMGGNRLAGQGDHAVVVCISDIDRIGIASNGACGSVFPFYIIIGSQRDRRAMYGGRSQKLLCTVDLCLYGKGIGHSAVCQQLIAVRQGDRICRTGDRGYRTARDRNRRDVADGADRAAGNRCALDTADGIDRAAGNLSFRLNLSVGGNACDRAARNVDSCIVGAGRSAGIVQIDSVGQAAAVEG